MGLADDLDGDGQPVHIVFDQPFREVIALRRTPDGGPGAWRATVGGSSGRLGVGRIGCWDLSVCRAGRRGVADLVGYLDVRYPFSTGFFLDAWLKLRHQHPHWALANIVDINGLKVPAFLVDSVGSQLPSLQAGRVEECAPKVDAESPWDSLGGCLGDG